VFPRQWRFRERRFGDLLGRGIHGNRGSDARRDALELEAGTAKDRAALRRLEGDGGFYAAGGALGAGFGARERQSRDIGASACNSSQPGAPGFAKLAALGIVLELLIEKKELLAGSKNKFIAAIAAF
jgi:hypothetical protein